MVFPTGTHSIHSSLRTTFAIVDRLMIKIDLVYLAQLGLQALSPEESKRLVQHVYEALGLRVGVELAESMTDRQLDEFEHYFEAKDDAGAFRWLEQNFPNYKEIVATEFEILTAELRQAAPTILTLLGAAS